MSEQMQAEHCFRELKLAPVPEGHRKVQHLLIEELEQLFADARQQRDGLQETVVMQRTALREVRAQQRADFDAKEAADARLSSLQKENQQLKEQLARIGQVSRASDAGIGRGDGPACKRDDVSEG